MTKRRVLAIAIAIVGVVGAAITTQRLCVGAWLRYGVTISECPDGEVHVGATINAHNMRRAQKGLVEIGAELLFARAGSMEVNSAVIDNLSAQLTLLRADQSVVEELKLDEKDAPDRDSGRAGYVTLKPDLPDGDYLLRAKVKTRAGETTVDAPLAIYAPAKIHVLTDRPLYEPGHTVKMRAVILRARDLVPLDDRPGKWIVTDPLGTVVLEEKAPAGEFGVVEGELPLDASSPVGTWTIRYDSGGASDAVPVEVKPFTLPRFTVDVDAAKPFYRAKDEPRVTVKVTSAAGLPVVSELALQWDVNGAWPAPPTWIAQLPQRGRTDRTGRMEIVLPRVPQDLVGKATVSLIASATDDSGDQEVGAGGILLAEDAIDVAAVTEFDGGLVEGLNNRMYLRATTAAGTPLDRVTLVVKRAWDRNDKGTTIETDEDGVASMQIDPGPAVTVVIPALPVRLPPAPPVVERTTLEELFSGEASLADIAAMDRFNASIAPCARFANGDDARVDLRVEPSGVIARAVGAGEAGRCIADALRGRSVSAGDTRIFQLSYRLQPALATLVPDVVGTDDLPDSIMRELESALRDARSCLGPLTTSPSLRRMILWEVGNNTFSGTWVRDSDELEEILDDARASCVEQKLSSFVRAHAVEKRPIEEMEQDEEDEGDGRMPATFGAVRLSVEPVQLPGMAPPPGPTTMLGYELLVSARAGDEGIGQTKLRLRPGQVPPIRLRPSEVIAQAGSEITIEMLRGPAFSGELPKKLSLVHNDVTIESDVDKDKRAAKFKLPQDKDGWFEARFDSGVARVFVLPQKALSVEVAPDKNSYKPGETAKLAVTTTERDAGISAAVGLFGVDATLAQLAPLAGADAMERILPRVDMQQKAFDVLDATALTLGRIRGKHAAAATVLLVSRVPTPEQIDVTTSAFAQTSFDPLLPLADRFYTVLESLYGEVRKFESTAPKDQKLTPQKMLELWDAALLSASNKGATTKDAFGRKLTLRVLPDELVALTDPRLVVADGTRLPEDIEAWVRFVRRSEG